MGEFELIGLNDWGIWVDGEAMSYHLGRLRGVTPAARAGLGVVVEKGFVRCSCGCSRCDIDGYVVIVGLRESCRVAVSGNLKLCFVAIVQIGNFQARL